MLIRNKKPFNLGIVFAISFFGVLLLIFSPVFKGKNGLQFADDSFNRLSKGSSYFIPKVSKSVEGFVGKPLSATINLEKADEVENTSKLFTTAQAQVVQNGTEIKIQGDLGLILQSAIKDADSMYNNDGRTVADRYGYNEKHVLKNWWYAFGKIEKSLKKDKLIAEAKVISDVNKKAIEPGYNFYKVDAQKVSDHAGMMSGLLIFYVAYTMWWGFAIYHLFEGIGLTMKKAKVKKEV